MLDRQICSMSTERCPDAWQAPRDSGNTGRRMISDLHSSFHKTEGSYAAANGRLSWYDDGAAVPPG